MNEKVSVIIPIYKVEKYIRRCIESTLAQTYRNLEIILVDDGSPDSCPAICDEYAKQDHRIKVIHKPNGGLSDARNAALKVFTGDYVYFLDGDDYVAVNLIEVALTKAVETSADLVTFNYYRVDEYDNLLSTSYFKEGIYEIDDRNRIDYIVNRLAKYTNGWEAWNRLFKGDVIRNNQLFFWNNKVIFAEDFGFSLNYAMHVTKIASISEVLYYYLIRKDSIMSQAAREPRLSASLSLCKLVEEKITASFDNTILQKKFPVLFYSIMFEQLRSLTSDNYKKAIAAINDKKYFYKQIRRAVFRFPSVFRYYGFKRGLIVLLNCILLLTRGLVRLNVSILSMNQRGWKIAEAIKVNQSEKTSKRRAFIIGSEDFNDLGGHLTAISELEYLRMVLPEHRIIEITATEYEAVRKLLRFIIRRKDLICLPGGGSIGSYDQPAVKIRNELLRKYPKHRKIIFPQSVHYEASQEGKLQLEEDQRIINKCKNLTLYLREGHSFELARQYFTCNTILVPDIVLYSDYSKRISLERRGALLLLQSDGEEALAQDDRQLVETIIRQNTQNLRKNEIKLISDVIIYDRKDVVEAFLHKIAQSEYVVTDCLQGMVFCTITQTPCILISKHNDIIDGVYEWVSNLEYILRIDEPGDLLEAVQRIVTINTAGSNSLNIREGFDVMTKHIRDIMR